MREVVGFFAIWGKCGNLTLAKPPLFLAQKWNLIGTTGQSLVLYTLTNRPAGEPSSLDNKKNHKYQ